MDRKTLHSVGGRRLVCPKMGDRKLSFCVIILIFNLTLVSPRAQHVQILSDRQWIELGIDLLRTGIQEEDTMKINMVLAPEVAVNNQKAAASAQLAQRFQTLFSGSANRTMRLAKPAFSRPDSPRHNSDFWDFDILDPKITITGDTAVVECELVLWGAPPDGINKGPGRKVAERLVFVSLPPAVQNSSDGQAPNAVGTNDEEFLTIEASAWPSGPYAHDPNNSRKSWKIYVLDNIMSILETEIKRAEELNSPVWDAK